MSTGPRTPIPIIDQAKCTACGRCVAACPLHLLSLQPRGWVKTSTLHEPQSCDGCAECFKVCPYNAIRMRRPAD